MVSMYISFTMSMQILQKLSESINCFRDIWSIWTPILINFTDNTIAFTTNTITKTTLGKSVWNNSEAPPIIIISKLAPLATFKGNGVATLTKLFMSPFQKAVYCKRKVDPFLEGDWCTGKQVNQTICL